MQILFSGYGKVKKPNEKAVYLGEIMIVTKDGARPHRLAGARKTASEAIRFARDYVAAVEASFTDVEDVVCPKCGDLLELFGCYGCVGAGKIVPEDGDVYDCPVCLGRGREWICPTCAGDPLGTPVINLMEVAGKEVLNG